MPGLCPLVGNSRDISLKYDTLECIAVHELCNEFSQDPYLTASHVCLSILGPQSQTANGAMSVMRKHEENYPNPPEVNF